MASDGAALLVAAGGVVGAVMGAASGEAAVCSAARVCFSVQRFLAAVVRLAFWMAATVCADVTPAARSTFSTGAAVRCSSSGALPSSARRVLMD